MRRGRAVFSNTAVPCVPPGVARLPRRPLAVAVACAMSVPDGAVAAAADPAAAGLLAPFLFRRSGAAGAVPPAGPLRAPLVEASRGPSPSAGTVSGAAAGCPAPLAPGRRPAAAREGWIGRRDGRHSLVPLAGIPVYALTPVPAYGCLFSFFLSLRTAFGAGMWREESCRTRGSR